MQKMILQTTFSNVFADTLKVSYGMAYVRECLRVFFIETILSIINNMTNFRKETHNMYHDC